MKFKGFVPWMFWHLRLCFLGVLHVGVLTQGVLTLGVLKFRCSKV